MTQKWVMTLDIESSFGVNRTKWRVEPAFPVCKIRSDPGRRAVAHSSTGRSDLFGYVGDHFIDDQPPVVELMKRKKLIVFKIVHLNMRLDCGY